MGDHVIPANVLRILAIVEVNGPMLPQDVSDRLRDDGVILHPGTIGRLPVRYSGHLRLDSEGRVCLAQPDEAQGTRIEAARTLSDASAVVPLEPKEIWVAQVDSGDSTPSLVLSSLTGQRLAVPSQAGTQRGGHPYPPEGPTLGLVICDARHRAQVSAVLAGVAPMAAVVAWQELAALVAVDEAYESIDDASTWLDIDVPDEADAVDRLASVVWALLNQVDPSHPNWSLAIQVLRAAQSPWARVLRYDPGEVDLDAALRPRVDPLLAPSMTGSVPFSAAAGTAEAMRVISEQQGMRTRSGQHEMAQAVASALDSGGTLVVEAPTGTGKTLAYLVPGAARAARSHAPVVIATHTKVLQRQVRAEVERLRGLGLFNVAFRQLFGVSNYVCAREIATRTTALLNGGAADEGQAIALAVGIRALAVTPNGVWDDAADHILIRTVAGYLSGRRVLAVEPDDCAGSECPSAGRCPLIMRRRSGPGDRPGVISTNHALVATMASAGHGEFLFGSGEEPATLIFDEAHRLEDSLTTAWTEETGRLPLRALTSSMGRRGRFGQACRTLEALGVSTGWRNGIEAAVSQYRPVEAELASAVGDYLHEYTAGRESVEVRRGVVVARPEYARVRDAAVRLAQLLAQSRKGLEEAAVSIRNRSHRRVDTWPARRVAGTQLGPSPSRSSRVAALVDGEPRRWPIRTPPAWPGVVGWRSRVDISARPGRGRPAIPRNRC